MGPLGGASFYIGLYREIHLKRLLFKNHWKNLSGVGIKVCANDGTCPIWGNFGYLKTIILKNYWPECIDIWYEATFGQGDSIVRK